MRFLFSAFTSSFSTTSFNSKGESSLCTCLELNTESYSFCCSNSFSFNFGQVLGDNLLLKGNESGSLLFVGSSTGTETLHCHLLPADLTRLHVGSSVQDNTVDIVVVHFKVAATSKGLSGKNGTNVNCLSIRCRYNSIREVLKDVERSFRSLKFNSSG